VARVGAYSIRVVVWAVLVATFAATTTPVFSAEEDSAIIGEWSSPVDVGVSGMHSVLLRTGQVLLWGEPQAGADARVVEPVSGAVTDAPFPFAVDMHCSGQTVLPDGRVLLFGGTPPSGDHFTGIRTVLTFDPGTGAWSSAGEMVDRRWYPAGVQLPSGKTLIVTGMRAKGLLQKTAELYDVSAGASRRLPTSANSTSDPYSQLFLLSSGKVFRAGPNRGGRLFNTTTNSWSSWTANMNFGWRFGGGAVLLPGPRILTAGGVNMSELTKKTLPATRSAEIMNPQARSPSWSYTGRMNFPRLHLSLVTLPDETVLAVGGWRASRTQNWVRAAELYSPNTRTWSVMDSQSADRGHHSTAVLLPDGRVLSAGSEEGNSPTSVDYFSPPYLFKGARPTIDSAPSSVSNGETFEIETQDAQTITKVALIRPSAITHAWNSEQRYVRLPFTKDAGKLTATVPSSNASVPPGYYMLFIVNDQGVPAVAPFIHVG
jgi:hypothetical protein